jgi:hypothetical protein
MSFQGHASSWLGTTESVSFQGTVTENSPFRMNGQLTESYSSTYFTFPGGYHHVSWSSTIAEGSYGFVEVGD